MSFYLVEGLGEDQEHEAEDRESALFDALAYVDSGVQPVSGVEVEWTDNEHATVRWALGERDLGNGGVETEYGGYLPKRVTVRTIGAVIDTSSEQIAQWARAHGGAEMVWETGTGDARQRGWSGANGIDVIETNGDPVWEDDEGFREAWELGIGGAS